MTNDTTYNGYTNYETWNVNLWIDNDQADQEFWIERATDCMRIANRPVNDTFIGTPDERAAYMLSNELKEHFEENMPEVQGTYADLLTAALGSVNWYEIAENLIAAAKDTA